MKSEIKVYSYRPEFRVSEFEGKFYVSMKEHMTMCVSSHTGDIWRPIPNFKLYDTKKEAIGAKIKLEDSDFKLEGECLSIDIETNCVL